ncbi:MAG: phosphatidate cytidylyltransferase [candidate division NC10 bacterium]|nr:phosphatidate cytidylyltransferase [candidate division NC10 bacterium]
MSPSAALQSEVFRLYLFIVGGLLGAAGVALAVLTWGLKKNVQSVWVTYRGWLMMVPAVMGCIFAGREATLVGSSLVALFGLKEFARATGLYHDWWMTGGAYLAIVAVSVVSLVADPFSGQPGWFGLFMTLPVYAIALLLMIPILRNRTEGQLQAVSLAIVGFIYIGWMFGHLGFLANSNHPYGYLLYMIFAVELNDVAAFTFGRLFGRHKLRSQISPNKTWEGSLGALTMSMIMPWILGFSFPHFGPVQRVLTGLIVGIGGQLGDLSISVIKRDLGVKDMGATIPGHGGILDRIDSLIYVAPLFLHMVNYFYGLR